MTSRPSIAITFDDPHTCPTPLLTAEQRDARILETLRCVRVRAALFVCGKRVDTAEGGRVLAAWNAERHIIANHSYLHMNLNAVGDDIALYTNDIVRAERLLVRFERFQKIFRYPLLKEGRTAATRDRVRGFLGARGYRVGHVTIDNSDWYIDACLTRRMHAHADTDIEPYRRAYLAHIMDRALYYDAMARQIVGRSPLHTLVLHHGLASSLFFGDLLETFASAGWGLVDADEAWADVLYRQAVSVLPAGESLIWSMAKHSGRFEGQLRYPAEDAMYERDEFDRLAAAPDPAPPHSR